MQTVLVEHLYWPGVASGILGVILALLCAAYYCSITARAMETTVVVAPKREPRGISPQLRMEVWEDYAARHPLCDTRGRPLGMEGMFAVDVAGNVMYRHASDASSLAWDVDHIVPYALGGETKLANLQPLNADLNRMKGERLVEDMHPAQCIYGITAARFRLLIAGLGRHRELTFDLLGVDPEHALGLPPRRPMRPMPPVPRVEGARRVRIVVAPKPESESEDSQSETEEDRRVRLAKAPRPRPEPDPESEDSQPETDADLAELPTPETPPQPARGGTTRRLCERVQTIRRELLAFPDMQNPRLRNLGLINEALRDFSVPVHWVLDEYAEQFGITPDRMCDLMSRTKALFNAKNARAQLLGVHERIYGHPFAGKLHVPTSKKIIAMWRTLNSESYEIDRSVALNPATYGSPARGSLAGPADA